MRLKTSKQYFIKKKMSKQCHMCMKMTNQIETAYSERAGNGDGCMGDEGREGGLF